MGFYVTLLAVNVACFLPVYLLHFREHPNPLELLTSGAAIGNRLKLLYSRPKSHDPFRINFDFTCAILLAAAAQSTAAWIMWLCSLLLAFGFVEILYTASMSAIFKRAPVLASDLKLTRAGLSIAQRHAYWIVPLCIAAAAAVVLASHAITRLLLGSAPAARVPPLLLAGLLLPPCLYHWRRYAYEELLSRGVYSPVLHLVRNIGHGRQLAAVLAKDESYFASRNRFTDLVLEHAPTIVIACVESYGSVMYKDAAYAEQIRGLLDRHETELGALGYGFASTHSEAPIFAGGSWLSYTSFTYGLRVDDLKLHDALFSRCRPFAVYESLFHVLKRNGYTNVLLCPLGGIDRRSVDWPQIRRCFQSDLELDFESVKYRGRLVNYFGMVRRYAPPDQYSLNFAYDRIRRTNLGPCCLFFCTLNSHYPWHSPSAAVEDWRSLNGTDRESGWTESEGRGIGQRYVRAIRYQLDFLLKFAAVHSGDDLLIVLFGDHQPPLLTPEAMGKHTPVHIIGKNQTLLNVFREHGFVSTLDLAGRSPREIRHEGFLSLFLKAMRAAYGPSDAPEIHYAPHGTALIDSR